MTQQQLLPFFGADDEWRLDEQTREVGRRGVAEARAALVAAERRAAAWRAAREQAQRAA